jgi:hypothetical protein
MGARLTTPPSSVSSSSTTAHRNTGNGSSTNLSHPRTHSTSTNHHSQHHRHRSSSDHHHNSRGLFANNSSTNNRHRTTSTNVDPVSAAAAFNFNLLRYVGLEQESEDQSSDDDSPEARRRLQRILRALRDVPCPICNKTIPSDSFDKHILQCLSKPRIDYNGLFSSSIDFNLFFLLL